LGRGYLLAKDFHPQFIEEQGLLKKVWMHCKRVYDDLNSRLENKHNKQIEAKKLGKEGYGDYH